MLRLLLTAVLCFAASAAHAQSLPDWAAAPSGGSSGSPHAVPGDDDPPSFPQEAPPQDVPIDGGLGLLALAGAGYAARKLRQQSAD